MDDYSYSYWFLVMNIFLQMTIHILIGFRHVHFCTNDYFVPNIFPMCFCKMGILSSWAYLDLMFRFHHVRNALQRVNSLVHLMYYNCYYNLYRFGVFEDNNLCVIFINL